MITETLPAMFAMANLSNKDRNKIKMHAAILAVAADLEDKPEIPDTLWQSIPQEIRQIALQSLCNTMLIALET